MVLRMKNGARDLTGNKEIRVRVIHVFHAALVLA